MNLEDEIAQATHHWRDHAIDGTPLGCEPVCNCYDYARAVLPLVKRAQAEAVVAFADRLTCMGVHTFNIHDIRKYAAENENKENKA